jgi:hypothetical protein
MFQCNETYDNDGAVQKGCGHVEQPACCDKKGVAWCVSPIVDHGMTTEVFAVEARAHKPGKPGPIVCKICGTLGKEACLDSVTHVNWCISPYKRVTHAKEHNVSVQVTFADKRGKFMCTPCGEHGMEACNDPQDPQVHSCMSPDSDGLSLVAVEDPENSNGYDLKYKCIVDHTVSPFSPPPPHKPPPGPPAEPPPESPPPAPPMDPPESPPPAAPPPADPPGDPPMGPPSSPPPGEPPSVPPPGKPPADPPAKPPGLPPHPSTAGALLPPNGPPKPPPPGNPAPKAPPLPDDTELREGARARERAGKGPHA